MMKKKKKEINRFDLLPIILLFAVHPLVMIGKETVVYISEQPWFPSITTQYDFFMYGKMVTFLLLAAWIGIILLDQILIRGKKITLWKPYIPMMLYLVFVILSAICSIQKDLSFKGMCEQYETVWVLIGYIIVVYAVAQMVKNKAQLRILLAALCVGAFVQGLLGISQLIGHDFWSTAAGKSLLTIGLGSEVRDTLSFSFAESGRNRVYMASYNPNYAGVYVILLLPIVAAAAVQVKKTWMRIGLSITVCLLLISLVGSGSRTGIAVLLCMIFVACVLRLSGKKRSFAVAACMIDILITGLLAEFCGGHIITKTIKNLKKREYDVHTLETDGAKVHMYIKKTEIWLDLAQEDGKLTLQVSCADGSELPTEWNEETQRFKIKEDDLKNWSFEVLQEGVIYYLHLQRGEMDLYFAKKQLTGDFAYVTQYGKIDQMIVAPTVLPGYERAFSERGYIWGRTLALLPSHFLLGTGADTFVVAFPQSDYIGKFHAGARMLQEIPSKAHSLYLQSGLQTGVLSLLCLLIFWGWYLIDSVRIKNRLPKEIRIWSLAIMLSVFGYLLMGLLNDSNLATAPIFWGILGMGIAVNRMKDCEE